MPQVLLKDDSFKPPEDPVYYIVAANGLYRVVNTPLYSATAKVEGLKGLCHQEERLDLKLPLIPQALMECAVGFFEQIYDELQSESVLLLHYHPERRRYRLVAPEQTVTVVVSRWSSWVKGEVDYEVVPTARGWVHVGDIHSHGGQGAFQSWTDTEDARFRDGLHIVVGRVNWKPDFDVAFTVAGRRFKLGLAEVCEGFQEAKPAPARWREKVVCQVEVSRSYGYTSASQGKGYGCDDYASRGYCPELPPGNDGFGRLSD
jgi:hypothetical protein